MPEFIAWQDRTTVEHDQLVTQYLNHGFDFVSLSVYGAVRAPFYAAVMIRQGNHSQHHHFASLTESMWLPTVEAERLGRYQPMIIAATGTATDALFAALVQPLSEPEPVAS